MRLPPSRRFRRSLAWASLALAHSFLGGGDDARAEVHSLPLALDPITVLDLTGTSITVDTQPYVLDEMTGLSVTLEVETVESFGLVVTSITFEPPRQTYLTGAGLVVTIPTSFGPIPHVVYAVDWFGQIVPHGAPVLATPSAPNRSTFEVSSLRYDIVGGYTQIGDVSFPTHSLIYHSAEPFQFSLSGTAELLVVPDPPSQTGTVILRLPIVTNQTTTDPALSISGELVMTGQIPLPVEELPLYWPVPVLSLLFLLVFGWRSLARQRTSLLHGR